MCISSPIVFSLCTIEPLSFRAAPEELENFDHPFKEEVIQSLEGLQEELTGLYSKRQFKVLYHTQLKRRSFEEAYCIGVFTLEKLEDITAGLGHEACQGAIRSLGGFINKHFGAIGGFSTRLHLNEIVAVVPFCDPEEAEAILRDFVEDFEKQGVGDIRAEATVEATPKSPVEFGIRCGFVQGRPDVEMETLIESARNRQLEIGRFKCTGEE